MTPAPVPERTTVPQTLSLSLHLCHFSLSLYSLPLSLCHCVEVCKLRLILLIKTLWEMTAHTNTQTHTRTQKWDSLPVCMCDLCITSVANLLSDIYDAKGSLRLSLSLSLSLSRSRSLSFSHSHTRTPIHTHTNAQESKECCFRKK